MARTREERLTEKIQTMLGAQQFQLANLVIENEMLKEQLQQAQAPKRRLRAVAKSDSQAQTG